MAGETWTSYLFVAVLLFVFLPVVYFFGVALPRRQQGAVQTDVERRGGRVVSIRRHRFFSLVAERNTRRWDVEFVDQKGRTQQGRAQTSIITGLQWLSGPFAEPPIA